MAVQSSHLSYHYTCMQICDLGFSCCSTKLYNSSSYRWMAPELVCILELHYTMLNIYGLLKLLLFSVCNARTFPLLWCILLWDACVGDSDRQSAIWWCSRHAGSCWDSARRSECIMCIIVTIIILWLIAKLQCSIIDNPECAISTIVMADNNRYCL